MWKARVSRKVVFGAQILRPRVVWRKKMIFVDATPRKEDDTKTKPVDEGRLQNGMSTGAENKSEGEMG